jgi:hypothetical protein
MSEPKILELLHTVGTHISAGQLSDLLIQDQEQFHAERAAVVRAGLPSSPWQHLDSTGTRVDGENQRCHVLCNPLHTAYCTLAIVAYHTQTAYPVVELLVCDDAPQCNWLTAELALCWVSLSGSSGSPATTNSWISGNR